MWKKKKQILNQHGEGFLALLLSPILESLAELVQKPVTTIYTSFQR
jgi:hypothetical protein